MGVNRDRILSLFTLCNIYSTGGAKGAAGVGLLWAERSEQPRGAAAATVACTRTSRRAVAASRRSGSWRGGGRS